MVRNDQQLVPLQLTPAARVTLAQFDEIDRPVEFVVPGSGSQFVLTGVDLEQRSGPDERIHRLIRRTKIAMSDILVTVARRNRKQVCLLRCRCGDEARGSAALETYVGDCVS